MEEAGLLDGCRGPLVGNLLENAEVAIAVLEKEFPHCTALPAFKENFRAKRAEEARLADDLEECLQRGAFEEANKNLQYLSTKFPQCPKIPVLQSLMVVEKKNSDNEMIIRMYALTKRIDGLIDEQAFYQAAVECVRATQDLPENKVMEKKLEKAAHSLSESGLQGIIDSRQEELRVERAIIAMMLQPTREDLTNTARSLCHRAISAHGHSPPLGALQWEISLLSKWITSKETRGRPKDFAWLRIFWQLRMEEDRAGKTSMLYFRIDGKAYLAVGAARSPADYAPVLLLRENNDKGELVEVRISALVANKNAFILP